MDHLIFCDLNPWIMIPWSWTKISWSGSKIRFIFFDPDQKNTFFFDPDQNNREFFLIRIKNSLFFLIRIKNLCFCFWSGSKKCWFFFDPDQKFDNFFLILDSKKTDPKMILRWKIEKLSKIILDHCLIFFLFDPRSFFDLFFEPWFFLIQDQCLCIGFWFYLFYRGFRIVIY